MCNIFKIGPRYEYVKHTYGTRNTRNTDDSLGSGTQLLLPSWLLRIWHEERETQFLLCWLFHLTQQPRVRTPQQTTRLASSRLKSQFVPSKSIWFSSKSLRIPAHCFRAWRHSHPQIVTSVIVISSPRARDNLH